MPLDILSKIADSQDKTNDKLEGVAKALAALESPLERLIKLQEKQNKGTEEYIKGLSKLISIETKAAGVLSDYSESTEDATDATEDQTDSIKDLNKVLEKQADTLAVVSDEQLDVNNLIVDNTDANDDAVNSQKKVNKAILDNVKALRLDNVEIQKRIKGFAEQKKATQQEIQDLIKRKKAAEEAKAGLSNNFSNLIEGSNFGGKVKGHILEDTSNELESLKGILGKNLVGWTAIGGAIVFATTKAKEYLNETKESAVEFSKFNIEQGALAKNTLVAPGGVEQLEELRKGLGLSRHEFEDFAKVLKDGSAQGVASTDELFEAASKLRDAFGGDQTERLKDYVTLLKEIPTVDTDLNITANVDDQTAAYFALAQKGQVSATIELQSAGLAGGAGVESGPSPDESNDVKLLNAAQASAAATEDIKAGLYKEFFPNIGPWVSELLNGLFGITSSVVGLGTIFYTTNTLLGNITKTADETNSVSEQINKETEEINRNLQVANSELNRIEAAINESTIKEEKNTLKDRTLRRAQERLDQRNLGGKGAAEAKRLRDLEGRREFLKGKFNTPESRLQALKGATKPASSTAIKTEVEVLKKSGGAFSKLSNLLVKGGGSILPSFAGKFAGKLAPVASTVAGGAVEAAGSAAAGGAAGAAAGAAGGVGSLVKGIGVGAIIAVAGKLLGNFVSSAGDKLSSFGDDLVEQGETIRKNSKDTEGGFKIASGGLAIAGGALVKFAGKVGGAAAEGAGFGAILGPEGAAVGAVIGAVVGGLLNYDEVLKGTGKGLKIFGDELNSTTEDGNKRYSLLAQGVGKITSTIGSFYETTGEIISSGTSIIGKGLSAIGNGALEAAGSLFNYVVLSKEGLEELNKNKKAQADAAKVSKLQEAAQQNLTTSLKETLRGQQQSALAFQSFAALIENSGKTAKAQIYEFGEQLAKTDLSALSDVGGTTEEFDKAISSATTNIRGNFKVVSEALEEARSKILKDSKLSPELRRKGLELVQEKELEATKKFVNSLLELVGQVNNIPSVIESNLQKRIAELKLDIGTRTSSLSSGDIARNIGRQLDLSFGTLETTITNSSNDSKLIAQIGDSLSKSSADTDKSITKGLDGIDVSSLSKENVQALSEIKTAIAKKDDNALKNLGSQISSSLDEKETAGAPDRNLVGLSLSLSKLTSEIAIKTKKQADEKEKQKKEKGGEASSGNTEADDVLAKKQEERKELEKTISEVVKERADIITSDNKQELDILDKYKKGTANAGEINEINTLAISQAAERNKKNEEERKQLGILGAAVEKTNSIQNANVIVTKATVKSTEALLTNLESYLSVLEKISDIADKSSGFQSAQRRLQTVEAETSLLTSIGQGYKSQEAILNEQVSSVVEYGKGLDDSIALLEKQKSKLSDIGSFYLKQSQEFANALDNAKKAVKPDFSAKELQAPAKTNNNGVSKIFGKNAGEDITASAEDIYDKTVASLEELSKAQEEAKKKILSSGSDQDTKVKELSQLQQSYASQFQDVNDALDYLSKVGATLPSGQSSAFVGKIKALQNNVTTYTTGFAEVSGALNQQQDILKKKYAENVAKLIESFDEFGKGFDKINQSLSTKKFDIKFDSSQAEAEVAAFQNNFADLGKSTTESINAAIGSYNSTIKQLSKSATPESLKAVIDKQVGALDEQISAIKKRTQATGSQSPEDKSAIDRLSTLKEELRINGQGILTAQLEQKKAEEELKLKNKVVDAAAKERSLVQEQIDAQQGLLETTASFLSETGGSVGQIIEVQQKLIGLKAASLEALKNEKAKIDAAQQAADAAGDQKTASLFAKDAALKQIEITKAQLNLQKDAIGAQRDAYEKLVATAFGSIRSSVGARKNVLSDAAVFGQNRVKLASGLNVKGGSQSIEQRQIGLLNATGGSAGLLGGPKRNPLEGLLEDATKAKEVNFSNGANGTTEKDAVKLAQSQVDYQKQTVDILGDISKNAGLTPNGTAGVAGQNANATTATAATAAADAATSVAKEAIAKGVNGQPDVKIKTGADAAFNRVPLPVDFKQAQNKIATGTQETSSISSDMLSNLKQLVSLTATIKDSVAVLTSTQFAKAFTDATGETILPALQDIGKSFGVDFSDGAGYYGADPNQNRTNQVLGGLNGSTNSNLTTTPDLTGTAGAGGGAAQNVKVDVQVEIVMNEEMFDARVRKIVTKDPSVQNDLENKFVTG